MHFYPWITSIYHPIYNILPWYQIQWELHVQIFERTAIAPTIQPLLTFSDVLHWIQCAFLEHFGKGTRDFEKVTGMRNIRVELQCFQCRALVFCTCPSNSISNCYYLPNGCYSKETVKQHQGFGADLFTSRSTDQNHYQNIRPWPWVV